jgi:phage terminase large subunit
MTVDLEANPKQYQFYVEAMKAVQGVSEKRNLLYGGAIRGGKSFICATIFLRLTQMYPNTRWHVIRSDFPKLVKTIIPTFEKIIDGSRKFKWSRDKSNYFIENTETKSKIFFMAENISHDPELNAFLGLETNGIYYEQIEELSKKLWNIGNSRVGSWYVDKMPKPLILATFNPSQSWIKQDIHVPFTKGELPNEFYYQLAFPDDNAFVTDEQKKVWDRMDERYKRQFISGDWSNFDMDGNRWAFAYDEQKHVIDSVPILDNQEIILSFDFNKNPICCSVVQIPNYTTIRVIETIKLANSDIYELCNVINAKYPNKLFIVTGDASGNNLNAMVADNMNYYKIIREQLRLGIQQFKVPRENPRIAENRVLVNSLLSRGTIIMDRNKTKSLQFDLENVSVLPDGSLKKADRNDPAQQADALDTLRYAANTFCSKFVEINN